MLSHMDESQNMLRKNSQTQSIFHSHIILEKAKLIHYDQKQIGGPS